MVVQFIQNLMQPWHIKNPIMFTTLEYSEKQAYSEHYQISKMEHFIKNHM